MYLISQDSTQKVRLLGGKYEINAGKYGVFSDAADFSFIGDKMKINVPDNSLAINGRIVNLLGGRFEANAPIAATHALTLDGVNLKVDASSPALDSKNLFVKNVSIDEYGGETNLNIRSTVTNLGESVIFGETVPEFVDYILLVILLCGVVAGISVPAIYRKKKKEALYKRLEEEGYIT